VEHSITIRPGIATIAAVVIPDAVAASWIFGRLQRNRPRARARRGAGAFALSAPLTLPFGYVFGELVGGYAEAAPRGGLIFAAIFGFLVSQWSLSPALLSVGRCIHPLAVCPSAKVIKNDHR
jgi:hypothetical protein